MASQVRAGRTRVPLSLCLLGGFELRDGGHVVALPYSAQRVVAFLALHERPLLRGYVAGRLWPEVPEGRSAASLRSALWRLGRLGHPVVEANGSHVRLAAGVVVDTVEVRRSARLLIERRRSDGPQGNGRSRGRDARQGIDAARFGAVLLPDWYEEWLVPEREQLRQLCLHALERLAEGLLAEGDHARAVDVALDAVRLEPLRESAHRLAARIHLAEGNRGEALRGFAAYRDLVLDELGVEPSGAFVQLLTIGDPSPGPVTGSTGDLMTRP